MRIGLLDVDIPVYHCAKTCALETDFSIVSETTDRFLRNWLAVTDSTHYLGFITDSPKNFRETRATTWPYKGNRIGTPKPGWYHAIREYVMDTWDVQLMQGIEADDALAISQEHFSKVGLESVIITEDKDLLQVSGLHYNPNKNSQVFRVSEEQAFKNLWLQVITGDRTDHIPGVSHAIYETATGKFNEAIKANPEYTPDERKKLYKGYSRQELYGPGKALSYLAEYELDLWPSKVLELYIDKYEGDGVDEGYGDLRFYETFDLIYMLRDKPDDVDLHFNFKEPPRFEGLNFEVY